MRRYASTTVEGEVFRLGQEVPSMDELLDDAGEVGGFFCDLCSQTQLQGILKLYPSAYKKHVKLPALITWAQERLAALSSSVCVAEAAQT